MSDSEDDFMVDDESDFDEEPALVSKSIKTKTSTKAPAKKKVAATSKAAIKKNAKSITLDSDDDEMPVSAPTVLSERSVNTPSKTKKKKTVEDTYKKMSQLEHILIRPDTYSK